MSGAAVVATVGLHGSASTWVFNVARECLIAAEGEARVTALYAESEARLPAAVNGYLVVKSHHGSPGLDAWLERAGARYLLSIRDPRDAALSMAQRFKTPLQTTGKWLMNDCARMLRLADGGAMVLRYEDRFFDDSAAVLRVAEVLGVRLAASQVDAIAQRYGTAATRAFALGLVSSDARTQIHAGHIGDTLSGKWRHLQPPVQEALTRAFGDFLDRFGYER